MNQPQIQNLIQNIRGDPVLHETHISWLILTRDFVYKIKKPVTLSFLDFSTLPLRAYYCKKELYLNQRTEPEMYLDVIPVFERNNAFSFRKDGEVVDYAVKMKRIPSHLQMDRMLRQKQVTKHHVRRLARKIAHFHADCPVIRNEKWDLAKDYWNDYQDLRNNVEAIAHILGKQLEDLLEKSCGLVHEFLIKYTDQIKYRKEKGFIRDVHGDLHSGNIFLSKAPILFDCIEFNDHFRQIDVLNDIGFLLMDLDAHGKTELGTYFLKNYLKHFKAIDTPFDLMLLDYFKSYRANVRAKVLVLKFDPAHSKDQRSMIQKIRIYFELMEAYANQLKLPLPLMDLE